jgi:DNA-binding transcriptional ArsR family regulator
MATKKQKFNFTAFKANAKKTQTATRAANHTLRLGILENLHEAEKMTVTELYTKMRIEQSVMSQHLAIMRRLDWVTDTRQGKFQYYSINYDKLNVIADLFQIGAEEQNGQGEVILNQAQKMPTGIGLLANG